MSEEEQPLEDRRPDGPNPAAASSLPEDAARVERYLRGKTDAFRELDGWIHAALRHRYPGLAEEHEDLAQVVHGKVFVSLKDGRYDKGRGLRAYVSGIVHHAAIDRLREIYRTRVLSDALSSQPAPDRRIDPYDVAEAVDEGKLFHQALLSVPPSCREMWRLLIVERLTHEEIGRRLSIPAGTVKSRMWHCRRKALVALRRLRSMRRRAAAAPRPRPLDS